MGVVQLICDRLTNVMSGMGTSVDRRGAAFYNFVPIDGAQAEAGYRSSWLVRKIVDIPPFDMTREWRDWQAEAARIEQLEAEERRLQIKAKCQRALILARLFGGSALLLGTGDSDTTQPLRPDAIRKGGLAYVHVMSRHQIQEGQPRLDPADPWFGQPDFFSFTGANGQQIKLHPSRILAFIGQKAPEGGFYPSTSWFWGDPIMQSIGEAVRNADTAQSGFSGLIDRASVDVLKLKDLMGQVSTTEGEERVKARLAAFGMGKSNWRAAVLDMEDDWQQLQVNWAGIPDVLTAFLNVVAGAADIPVTRLLGQSPKGLQSTGDGEERDYLAMVRARQNELLAPALDRIDDLLIPSALGSRPTDVYYEFAPLMQLSEKDASAIEKQKADTVKVYADTGLLPDAALSAMAKNSIIEGGRWPGSEAAFEEAEAAGDDNQDPDQLTTQEERVAAMEKTGTLSTEDAVRLITDAKPRTLYVSRKLLNGEEVVRWAKAQGFETTVPADELHVTICFSRTPVDWMAMGESWSGDDQGRLRVKPGGARMLDIFGNVKQAVVLLFNSSELSWRHEDMKRNGASFDFEQYQPHVTITYEAPADLDLAKVEPFQGELLFGPEIFAEVDEDWSDRIVEDGGSRHGDGPFSDANPYHRGRGPGGGQFTTGPDGGSVRNFVAKAKAKPKLKEDLSLGAIEANALSEFLGFTRVINTQEVRKNLNKHGKDANPLVAADFNRIPEIVSIGSYRVIGVKKASKPVRVEYRATLNGKSYIYVETVGQQKRRVALLSFYVESGPEG